MGEAKRRRLANKEPAKWIEASASIADTWERCQYRTLLGAGADDGPAEMIKRVAGAYALIGTGPLETIPPEVLTDIVAAIGKGRTYLLLCDDKAQRDYMKQLIAGIVGPAAGCA